MYIHRYKNHSTYYKQSHTFSLSILLSLCVCIFTYTPPIQMLTVSAKNLHQHIFCFNVQQFVAHKLSYLLRKRSKNITLLSFLYGNF